MTKETSFTKNKREERHLTPQVIQPERPERPERSERNSTKSTDPAWPIRQLPSSPPLRFPGVDAQLLITTARAGESSLKSPIFETPHTLISSPSWYDDSDQSYTMSSNQHQLTAIERIHSRHDALESLATPLYSSRQLREMRPKQPGSKDARDIKGYQRWAGQRFTGSPTQDQALLEGHGKVEVEDVDAFLCGFGNYTNLRAINPLTVPGRKFEEAALDDCLAILTKWSSIHHSHAGISSESSAEMGRTVGVAICHRAIEGSCVSVLKYIVQYFDRMGRLIEDNICHISVSDFEAYNENGQSSWLYCQRMDLYFFREARDRIAKLVLKEYEHIFAQSMRDDAGTRENLSISQPVGHPRLPPTVPPNVRAHTSAPVRTGISHKSSPHSISSWPYSTRKQGPVTAKMASTDCGDAEILSEGLYMRRQRHAGSNGGGGTLKTPKNVIGSRRLVTASTDSIAPVVPSMGGNEKCSQA